jgi:hypothetical protein
VYQHERLYSHIKAESSHSLTRSLVAPVEWVLIHVVFIVTVPVPTGEPGLGGIVAEDFAGGLLAVDSLIYLLFAGLASRQRIECEFSRLGETLDTENDAL